MLETPSVGRGRPDKSQYTPAPSEAGSDRASARRTCSRASREEAREYIAREGYDPVFGARPLKRFLQALIAGEVTEGSVVDVGIDGGSLDVAIRPAESAVSA